MRQLISQMFLFCSHIQMSVCTPAAQAQLEPVKVSLDSTANLLPTYHTETNTHTHVLKGFSDSAWQWQRKLTYVRVGRSGGVWESCVWRLRDWEMVVWNRFGYFCIDPDRRSGLLLEICSKTNSQTQSYLFSRTHTHTNIKLQSDGAVSAGRLPQINDRLKKVWFISGWECGEREREEEGM